MCDELPEADAYHLQYQRIENKSSGCWESHSLTTSRQRAGDFLDSTPDEVASRAVPLEAFPGEAVTVTGVVYDHPTAGEYEAAAR